MKSRPLLLIVGMLVLALPLGCWFWVRLATRASLVGGQLAALRAQGQPVALADLAGQPVAAADNVSAGLDALAPQLAALEPAVATFLNGSERPDWPSAAQLAAATQAIADHGPLLLELAAVAERPSYQPVADYARPLTVVTSQAMERLQRVRLAMRLLGMQAQAQLAAGQTRQAYETTRTMLRLARKAEAEPLLNGYLVASAVRRSALSTLADTLAAGDPSPEERQALAAELSLHDPQAALRHALATERAFGISSFAELKAGGAGWLFGWYWNDDLSRYLTLIEEAAPGRSEPATTAPSISVGGSQFLGTLTRHVAPAVDAAVQAAKGDLATVRSARILLALAGRAAAPLPTAADLGLPAGDWADPFAAAPLKFKPLPGGGWQVYSVGPDGRDDGGDPQRDRPLEASPPTQTAP